MATKKKLENAVNDIMPTMDGLQKKSQETFSKVFKAQRSKPNNDYVRLDLRPNGVDLKAYVEKQAREQSAKQGRTISATRYIQELIEKDKDASQGKRNKRQDTVDMILSLDEGKYKAVSNLLKEFTK